MFIKRPGNDNPLGKNHIAVLKVFRVHGKDSARMAAALSKGGLRVSPNRAEEIFQTALSFLGGTKQNPWDAINMAEKNGWLPPRRKKRDRSRNNRKQT